MKVNDTRVVVVVLCKGLNYITEYQSGIPGVQPVFVCELCKAEANNDEIMEHLFPMSPSWTDAQIAGRAGFGAGPRSPVSNVHLVVTRRARALSD